MAAHKHAKQMKQYAEDAIETEKPWERWEVFSVEKRWTSLRTHPCWRANLTYRRKQTKKVVDLSTLIESGIDCEFGDNLPIPPVVIGKLTSINSTDIFKYSKEKGIASWKFCRPRLDHWHFWQGGKCPLPEGFLVDVMLRDSTTVKHQPVTAAIWKARSDIIAFKVIGLEEGYIYPWEAE